MGKGQKFSSHGSMTKAGKVINRTPKVERTGVNSKPKKIPRIRYKELYNRRILDDEFGGQKNSIQAKQHKKGFK